MPAITSHLWIRGGRRADRLARIESVGLPSRLVAAVDAHQRLRGPYTAAGTVVRRLIPDVVPAAAQIIRRYDIEVLSVAPELDAIVPGSRETLTSMAIPKERTRFYAPLRTRRIANGLVELIRGSLPDSPRSLVFENVEHAESTDLEFVAALVRRVDPARLTIVICTGSQNLPSSELRDILDSHAKAHNVVASGSGPPAGRPRVDAAELARRYVDSDCTSDEPDLLVAYDALDPEIKVQLHDQRAAVLAEGDEQSRRLGAIPFHLEHGSDPGGLGANALRSAQDYCRVPGFLYRGDRLRGAGARPRRCRRRAGTVVGCGRGAGTFPVGPFPNQRGRSDLQPGPAGLNIARYSYGGGLFDGHALHPPQ